MHLFAALQDDYDDEIEAKMTDVEETTEDEEGMGTSDQEELSLAQRRDFISPQMRDFVVPHAEDECWGIANYRPPNDLEHLVSKQERKNLIQEALNREAAKALRPCKKPTAIEDSRRRTQSKLRAMRKEAKEWQSNMRSRGQQSKKHTTKSTSHRPYKIEKPVKRTQRPIPDSWKTSKVAATIQRANPYTSLMAPPKTLAPGAHYAYAREGSVASKRSMKSESRRRNILDEIQWDSE